MRVTTDARLLDVRPAAAFASGHVPESAGIPLEELADRPHELPPPGTPIAVFDMDWDRSRQAVLHLRNAGYKAEAVSFSGVNLTEAGPATGRLWQPSPFLGEVLDRIGAGPAPRRAVDLGCGAGREAVVMAQAGFAMTVIDVLPDALDRGRTLAGRWGITLACIHQDLRRKPVLPADTFHLVTMFRFYAAEVIPAVRAAVLPGGWVAGEVFHAADRRAPRNAVADGALAEAFAGFEILIGRDGVKRDGRVFAQILARKP